MHTDPFRPFLPLALLAALCAPGMAAAAEPAVAYLGEENCRIARLEPAPKNGAVSWDGACKDGYASGKDVLAWRDAGSAQIRLEATLMNGEVSGEGILKKKAYTYTGTLRNGVPHGQGYFEYADNKGWYEGEVANGRRHGKGIRLHVDRSRYTGDWVDGERHGLGEATFATGGSYTGAWKDDRFDGHGKIVYAGSGRTYEGLFKDGRVAGLPEPELDKGSYSIRTTPLGSLFPPKERITTSLPINASWDNLSPAQKNTVRAIYPALEAGDEPPFPVKGERALFDAVQRINKALGVVEGHLGVYVLVGKEGKPLSVTTYGAPNPALVRAVSHLVMLEQYKPARCQGEPCEMVFALNFVFSVVK